MEDRVGFGVDACGVMQLCGDRMEGLCEIEKSTQRCVRG